MFKIFVMLALAVATANAQEAPAGEAAAEPYSYGYQTDTHAASEQRDPSGRVSGFYTLADADGRERRVEYVADEAGFRAKIATNEVGTKSQNPANVEIQASEPSPAQFAVYQQAPQVVSQQYVQQVPQVARQQYAQQAQRVVTNTATTVQQPFRSQQVAYYQQPGSVTYGYGYYPGYGYANQNADYYGRAFGYNQGYYSYGSPISTYTNGLAVGNYNNHLPSQYYSSLSSVSGNVPSSVRYVSQPGVSTTTTTTRGVNTVSYPVGGAASYSSRSSSNSGGSSNYLVLQKRDATADDKKKN